MPQAAQTVAYFLLVRFRLWMGSESARTVCPRASACQSRFGFDLGATDALVESAMIVESNVAQIFSTPSRTTCTSARQTVSVRPARITCPRAINNSPSAGATKFNLYSTERTLVSGGVSEY